MYIYIHSYIYIYIYIVHTLYAYTLYDGIQYMYVHMWGELPQLNWGVSAHANLQIHLEIPDLGGCWGFQP